MDTEKIQQFLDSVKSERQELPEDLRGLRLNASNCKVGDFGCGWGYITWCLMLQLPNSKCFGIDKFDPNEPPNFYIEDDWSKQEPFSFDNVQSRSRKVIDGVRSGTVELPGNDLFSDIRHMIIDEERFPEFQEGNLVTGEGLSPKIEVFDFIYCKRVLWNIYEVLGTKNLNKAVNHIANALKPDGWLCLVEVDNWGNPSTLNSTLEKAGFRADITREVSRPYKTLLKIYPQYKYLIHHCQKTK